MLETSRVTSKLEEARAFAYRIGLRPQLEERLTYLERYANPKPTRCVLFPDRAPHSFYFVMEREIGGGTWMVWFEGGLIYHGPHDNHGSGAYPALAVTVTPETGWSIHT